MVPATSGKNPDKRDIYFLFSYLNVRRLNRTDSDNPDNLRKVRLCPDMLPDNYVVENKVIVPFVRENSLLTRGGGQRGTKPME